jgi:hypothetical protein
MTKWIAAVTVTAALAASAAFAQPGVMRGRVPMTHSRVHPAVHPVDAVMMNLRQLEMTAFLSPQSRMALADARFEMQSVAWRTQRGFSPSGFELDRVMSRLAVVARDRNLSGFDRMRLNETAWALRSLRFGGGW